MTDTELCRLYAKRRLAWQRLGALPRFLKDLPPDQRELADHHSAEFRRLDAQIVAELRKRNAPASIRDEVDGRIDLHLTRDLQGFAPCRDGLPICRTLYEPIGQWIALLHRYPSTTRAS